MADDADASRRLHEALRQHHSFDVQQRASAVREFERLASHRCIHAQHALGCAYIEGRGCAKDVPRGERLLRDAAGRGSLGALVELGNRTLEPRNAAIAFQFAAKHGHPVGMLNFGLCCVEGRGVPQNFHTGVELVQQAVAVGEPQAIVALARWLLLGDFVQLNEKHAVGLLGKAFDMGYWPASELLARCYFYGTGTAHNPARGREILSKAAEAGYAKAALLLALRFKLDKMYHKAWPLFQQASSDGQVDAVFYMALMHLRGNGTERDPSKAIQFLDEALERGCSKAAYHLANIYLCGEHVPADYSKKSDYMEVAQSISEKLAMKARKGDKDALGKLVERSRGDASARSHYAVLLATGQGVELDQSRAKALMKHAAIEGDPTALFDWYRMRSGSRNRDRDTETRLLEEAAAQEHPKALFELASLVENTDRARAERLYKHATETSYPKAMRSLALLLAQRPSPDQSRVFKLFQRAADSGFPEAFVNVGYCLEKGYGVQKNFESALQWFCKAGNAGVVQGMLHAGSILETRRDVTKDSREKDLHRAHDWYAKAAKRGSEEAARRISTMLQRADGGNQTANKKQHAHARERHPAEQRTTQRNRR